MNIIVIGGTRGIGKELVLNLAQDINNQVLVTGRNEIALKSLSSRFKNVHTLRLDLLDFESKIELFRKTVNDHFREVDILINMAGFLLAKEFADIEIKEARMMMEINFLGPASVIRVLKPFMSNGSHILNITSMGGFQGSAKYKGLSYYSASKAALACLSECLAEEFKDSGISVNCLALGSVKTEMFDEAFPGHKASLDASEMAEFIAKFAFKGHKYINGKIIPVALSNP